MSWNDCYQECRVCREEVHRRYYDDYDMPSSSTAICSKCWKKGFRVEELDVVININKVDRKKLWRKFQDFMKQF